MDQSSKSITGRRRSRKTRRSVIIADASARTVITVGGVGTILAVLGVCLFLVWVAMPLFLPAEMEGLSATNVEWAEEPLHMGIDEYQTLGWVLLPSGKVDVFRLDNGEVISSRQVFPEGQLVSASFLLQGSLAVFGLADGTVQIADVGFRSEIGQESNLAPEVAAQLKDQGLVTDGESLLETIPGGQFRRQQLEIDLGEAIKGAGGRIHAVTHSVTTTGPMIIYVADHMATEGTAEGTEIDGSATDSADDGAEPPSGEPPSSEPPSSEPQVAEAAETAAPVERLGMGLFGIRGVEESNFLTGQTRTVLGEPVELPFEAVGEGIPQYLQVSGTGTDTFVGWRSGELLRLEMSRLDTASVAEKGRLVAPGKALTAMRFILGNTTMIWGDSEGAIRGGFLLRRTDYDGGGVADMVLQPSALRVFVETKDLGRLADSEITTLAPSARSRLMFTGSSSGHIRLSSITQETALATVRLGGKDGPAKRVSQLIMTPKEDGLLAFADGKIYRGSFDPGYPEASLNGLFMPVWYEGYTEPLHLWQSSSGTDDFEPKMGLYPLIFGTLKATFYSMLFGAPLALLAAIFSSELLAPRAKAVIKPTIELMASLPSVVLGFLAALVVAPFVEDVVPATLAIIGTLPLAFLLGAYLWQILPSNVALRWENWRFLAIAMFVPLGLILGFVIGPVMEDLFFGGNLKRWLAWGPGADGAESFADPTGGWLFLFLPLSALLVAVGGSRITGPIMRERGASWDRRQYALADAARFAGSVVVTLVLAYVLSALCAALGFDPRGGYVDTYVQRNAMIVGFAMGFAIIPIIYTISEDALSTVPEHLRSASLGAGATPWQTAVRIVIPTAMSGLFSAMMVGLGRAVGETMIVLMAAGNTPILEWNIFEGFRTLSANIAVELPEAVKDSGHYRTLFLAALVLFVMTFVLNTVAEIIRARFRKRAYQL